MPPGGEHARRAVDETDGGCPGRDVDHVAAEDDVGGGDGPRLRGGVERERGANVRQARGRRPGVDAGAGGGVRVARLKDDLRPARAGKVHGVLARAARHLEHQALRRQVALQDGPDRVAVARRGGRILAGVIGHACLSCARARRSRQRDAAAGAPASMPGWKPKFKSNDPCYLDIHEDDQLDEAQLAA